MLCKEIWYRAIPSIRVYGWLYSAELFSLGAELVPFDHKPYHVMRPPHHPGPRNQLEPAAILEDCRPVYRHIQTRSQRRCVRAPQTHSSTADVQGFGGYRRMTLMRFQYGVPGCPPKWKSSRSTALIVHTSIMITICNTNNRQKVSFVFGTIVPAADSATALGF
jgi:hypothetical protein